MTFSELKSGTVLTYNDASNLDEEYIVLCFYSDQFGNWVDMIHKESNCIQPHNADSELGSRWKIIANK